MQKAFYTYRTNDEDFEKSVVKMLETHQKLQTLVYSKQVIEEFKTDPFDMSVDDFKAFYEKLTEKYGGSTKPGLSLAGILQGLQEEHANEPQEGKDEKVEETIIVPESYSSLDRQLRAQQSKEKKSLETAEKVESVTYEGSQISEKPAEKPAETLEKPAEMPIEKPVEQPAAEKMGVGHKNSIFFLQKFIVKMCLKFFMPTKNWIIFYFIRFYIR